MTFNFLTNLETCFSLVRDTVNLPLIYYSHIPTAVISLIIGILVLMRSRSLESKILFSLSVTFTSWVICSLITWTSYNSMSYMFFWSMLGMLTMLMSILCFYLVFVFLYKKDVSFVIKIFSIIFMLPVFFLTPSKLNLINFDAVWCYPIENSYFSYYYYFFALIAFLGIGFIFLKNIKTNIKNKKENILFVFGVEFFIVLFFFTDFYASYLVDKGYLNNYNIAPYGLFGMVIFMSFIAYLIVKFKTFDIKIIGAQALVWALVIVIGSEFFFVESLTNQILVGVTLAISSVLGLALVRSVKKEILLREQLEVANNNQASLIHFISHQLKGFFTKSKMIFSGLIEGDFGEVSKEVIGMAQVGLTSDNNAVAMVQDILKASNLKTGVTDYTYQKLDLAGIVRKVANRFIDEMQGKGLEYNIDIPNQVLPSIIDETHITQVFKNLIDNSFRYTPSGKINVSVKVDSNIKKILCVVSDTGVGLSPEDQKKLFTEGGKGEESMKVNTDSTGYGLYIVKKIVESHHGRIWAESAGRGHGSKFSVELNLVE